MVTHSRRATPRTCFLGIDVGTSRCKAVALDGAGRVLAKSDADYPTRRGSDGEVTQRPADWLRAVRSVIRVIVEATPRIPVEGVGITAPAHVVVLADALGEPLAPALLAFDARPQAVVPRLRAAYGDAFYEATFVELTAGWSLAQLTWIRDVYPELWFRINFVLPQKDWIRYRMTGVARTDASDAAGMAMLDQRRRTWLPGVCADLGLAVDRLPPIEESTSSGGTLSGTWARQTGLPAGTPVVIGATDTACELVSVGAIAAGQSLVKVASTGIVVAVTDTPTPDRRLLTYPHAIPGGWYTLGATNTATVAYQWLRENVFRPARRGRDVSYAEMDRLAAVVGAGADGLLFVPFLQGERTPYWDPHLRAAFVGLASGHGRPQLARAVLEGVAFSLRECRDTLQDVGLEVTEPQLGGGGIKSRLWRDIIVSVLGLHGRLSNPQGPAIGAALMAAAQGSHDIRSSIDAMTPRRMREIVPRDDWPAVYDHLYQQYRAVARALAPVSRRLAVDPQGASESSGRPGA